MTLVRWEPFRNAASLQDRINGLFDDAFLKASHREEGASGSFRPGVDIYDTKEAIVIETELPGVLPEDVSVEVNDHVLSLKGEKKWRGEVNEDQFYRKERVTGRFHRAFSLPVDVDQEKIQARFQNGVLRLEVPKAEEKKPRKIAVQVAS